MANTEDLFIVYRMVAVYQHSCACKVARQLHRRSQMVQAMAFDVWVQYTQHCQETRVRLQQVLARAAHAKMAGAFKGWVQWTAASTGIPSVKQSHQV